MALVKDQRFGQLSFELWLGTRLAPNSDLANLKDFPLVPNTQHWIHQHSMGKKFQGGNTKAQEAKERKSSARKEEQEKKTKQKEDALWEDESKHSKAKDERKKKQEEKRLADIQRKNEARELLRQEDVFFPSSLTLERTNKEQKQSATETDESRNGSTTRKRLEEKERRRKESKTSYYLISRQKQKKEEELQPNINHIIREEKLKAEMSGEEIIEARSLSDAIEQLTVTEQDQHPEKRLKAAFRAYEEVHLPLLRKENPSLKLSQVYSLSL